MWPSLSLAEWEPTYKTLHRYTQIVGKVRLALCSPVNHWWHTTLRFTARGLTTTLMPFGNRQLEIAFDFVDHAVKISSTDGVQRVLPLVPESVASFHRRFFAELDALGFRIAIWPMPVEIPNPVRFTEDHENASYDREAVSRMWSILANVHAVFAKFRGEFRGKSSPVHFFWGAFDVAVTRFSGRANPNPPPDPVMREAYSDEVISHGFWFGGDWPNGGRVTDPIFYAYALPEPAGFADATVRPPAAAYSKSFGEFILPYDAVRASPEPAAEVLAFLRSTYDAGASLAAWDRSALENAS